MTVFEISDALSVRWALLEVAIYFQAARFLWLARRRDVGEPGERWGPTAGNRALRR